MNASRVSTIPSPSAPDLGGQLRRREQPASARELYCVLFVNPEENTSYLAPAYEFACAALERVRLPGLEHGNGVAYWEALLAWAASDLVPFEAEDYGSSWPVRLVREFAPVGLADGAWLSPGLLRMSCELVSGDGAQALREQLRLSACSAFANEGHAQRFAALLASLGIPVQASSRWDFDESPPCADISYEHALLGLTLGAFPETFTPELLGLNLWMTAVGPCPLLERLREELALRSASTEYFDRHERARLKELALESILDAASVGDPEVALRITRGFCAAHASYRRWDDAMRGANIPYAPRAFVLEAIRRKARFAIDHHREVKLKNHNLAELLSGGEKAHELLLDHLAETASLIRKGSPDRSPFMTHTLSLDGPMFDSFTAEEKNDLREWIASLGRADSAHPPQREPLALVGHYTAPADPDALSQYAAERYGSLPAEELADCLAQGGLHPCARGVGRALLEQVFGALEQALAQDARLAGQVPPAYGEGTLASLLQPGGPRAGTASTSALSRSRAFLRGAADVTCASFEEHGWLLRRYLVFTEQSGRDVQAVLPPSWRVLSESLALHPRAFLPEILGLNLAFERHEAEPTALSKTHRSWATFAVHAFLGRVREGCPDDVEAQWQRIWRAYRMALVLREGSPLEREALRERLETTASPFVGAERPTASVRIR